MKNYLLFCWISNRKIETTKESFINSSAYVLVHVSVKVRTISESDSVALCTVPHVYYPFYDILLILCYRN